MQRMTIEGKTVLKLGFSFPQLQLTIKRPSSSSSLLSVDFTQKIEFLMHYKQLDIIDVRLIDTDPSTDELHLRVIETRYVSAETQANACRTQPSLKLPTTYGTYVSVMNEVQRVSQQLAITMQFVNAPAS
jgi:hypothetical protein